MGDGQAGKAVTASELVQTALVRFWFKMFGTIAFTLAFFIAYVYLLRHPAFTVATMPALWLDRAVAFEPLALPVYVSLWAYVSLPPVLMTSRREICAYGARIALLCLIALAVFYRWPTAVPPAHIDWARYPGVAFLKHVDAAGNACPSLHVATAVFSALWLFWRLRLIGAHAALRWINAVWCVAIVYSTLATKQHVAIDALAGTALALAAAYACGLRAHAERRARMAVFARLVREPG